MSVLFECPECGRKLDPQDACPECGCSPRPPSPRAMNLYLLTRRPPEMAHCDQAEGFVVAAPTGQAARALIADGEEGEEAPHYGDEGPNVWLNPAFSDCRLIGTATATMGPRVLIRDYNAFAW